MATAMATASDQTIVLEDVSKFYGEILGVNKINLTITPGITSLVGPNGSGKTTLMNLMTGLLRPSRGRVRVLGISPSNPEEMFRHVGYSSQHDSFPAGATGFSFINSYLRVAGFSRQEAEDLTWRAIDRIGLVDAAHRKVAGYSKGMRQRVRLGQSLAHNPSVLILDEPLNGLDPMARAEAMRLFRQFAEEGLHLIMSSHILHELDMMSDRVVLLNNGYIVAEGEIQGVRDEMREHPMQILIRCDRPSVLAARAFESVDLVEARVHEDGRGLFVKTRNPDSFYLFLNGLVAEGLIGVEAISPVDDDLNAVYGYLIGSGGGTA